MSTLFGEFFGVVGDVLDPVLVQATLVTGVIQGAVTTTEEGDEVPFTASLDPPIIILLHSGSTPPSLRAIGGLDARMQDTVLATLTTVLRMTDGSHDRSELGPALGTDVDLDGIVKRGSACGPVLGLDGLGGLTECGGSEEDHSEECFHVHHCTILIDQMQGVTVGNFSENIACLGLLVAGSPPRCRDS